MPKRIIVTFFIFVFSLLLSNTVFSADEDATYTKLTTVDLNTFNEYRYRLTEQFFELRNTFEIEGSVNKTVASRI